MAGTDRALIDAAAPAASPTHTASVRRGVAWSSARSAKAIASTESASDGPSALTGPVTQSTEPLVVTSPAASSAWPRVVTRRAQRVHRDREEHARRDREEARRVEGAEPEQVGEPDEREEHRPLAREHVAERLEAVAHRQRRRRVDAVVEHQRPRGEERGQAQQRPRPHRGPARRSARAGEPGTRRLRSASRWPSSKGTVAVREVWGAAWYGRQRSFSRSSHGRISGSWQSTSS